MISAPLHPSETARLQDLLQLEVLDSSDEAAFDELTQLASAICGTNISLISLVDHDRQWFKSRVGLSATETARDIAFCSHAILQDEVFEVKDASLDKRFSDNPLVTEDPSIRFYAGAPLLTQNGYPIGTLCVIDQTPKSLNKTQTQALKTLAKQVINQLEIRLHNRQLARMQKEQEQVMTMLAHDLRTPFNGILSLSRILKEKAGSVTPERLQALSSSILESSIKVYQLLDEILQWSRNNIQSVQPTLITTSVEAPVFETIEFMQEAFNYKNITVTYDIPNNLKAVADASLLKTVIRNLLANAVKFSPVDGEINIHAASNNHQIELSIMDNGKGVDKNTAEQLFNQNVQSQAGSRGEQGLGIGLKNCHDFMHKMNGAIRLDTSYEHGAKFIISLPASNE